MTFKKINENEQQNLHDRSCMILVNFNAKELAAIKTVSNFAGIRDRIAVKRKINLEWAPLTQDQSSILLQAVNDVFFTVEFPDPQLGIISRTMYVGDRTAPAYAIVDGQAKWSGIKMNFVER